MMHAGGWSRLLPGPMRGTSAALAAAIAIVTATAAVAIWSNQDLPVFLKARLAAPVPPAAERLFGPPLRRIRLDDQTPDFEPEAYHMCVLPLQHVSCTRLVVQKVQPIFHRQATSPGVLFLRHDVDVMAGHCCCSR